MFALITRPAEQLKVLRAIIAATRYRLDMVHMEAVFTSFGESGFAGGAFSVLKIKKSLDISSGVFSLGTAYAGFAVSSILAAFLPIDVCPPLVRLPSLLPVLLPVPARPFALLLPVFLIIFSLFLPYLIWVLPSVRGALSLQLCGMLNLVSPAFLSGFFWMDPPVKKCRLAAARTNPIGVLGFVFALATALNLSTPLGMFRAIQPHVYGVFLLPNLFGSKLGISHALHLLGSCGQDRTGVEASARSDVLNYTTTSMDSIE